MKKESVKFKVVDLFSGCGGLSLGFKNAGYNIVAAFDNWKPAIDVYRANFRDHDIIEYDLSNYNGDASIIKEFKPDIIIGGPPCQDFSHAGKRDETLGRANLTIKFAQIISDVKPQWFVMENVDRALTSKTFQLAKKMMKESGYGLRIKILDASYCGAPQKRKRLFVIGELGGEDNGALYYLESKLMKKPMTVREYLGNKINTEYYYRHPRNYNRRAIYSIDEPSATIRGVSRPVPPNYNIHPNDATNDLAKVRPLTTKERSLIQTFPDEFVFVGTKTDVEQMIGNAVPIKLTEYVARSLKELISKGPAHNTNLTLPFND